MVYTFMYPLYIGLTMRKGKINTEQKECTHRYQRRKEAIDMNNKYLRVSQVYLELKTQSIDSP